MIYFITNGICKLGTYGSNPNILMVCEDHKREVSQEGIRQENLSKGDFLVLTSGAG